MVRRSSLALWLILLLAALLRFYRLDAQSLWSDEGSSAAQALRDIPAIAQNAASDIHPPLYYIALHDWVTLFGTSEAGLRSLSAALGIALVLLCYVIGRRVWGESVGLSAAWLCAINPFQIYYAQEARMYMLMAALGALVIYAALEAVESGQMRWHIVYTLGAAMGLYTHYFFPVVLVISNIWFAWSFPLPVRERGRGEGLRSRARLMLWGIAQLAALAAFLPWLPTAWRQITTWPAGAQTFTAASAPIIVLRTLSEGLSAPSDDGLWLALFAMLVIAGAWPGRPPDKGVGAGLAPARPAEGFAIVLYLLAPFAMMFALGLFKDAFLKFMLIASPAFILLTARGISRITSLTPRLPPIQVGGLLRPLSQAALLLLPLLPSALSLQAYYGDSRFARDDYRGIAQTISALARAGDAVILDAPGQQEIFRYYYQGSLPVYALPRQRPPDVDATTQELAALTGAHARVFIVLWATDESDPTRVVESWLDAHSFKASDNWYGNVRLALYASAQTGTAMRQTLNLRWGDGISLLGYTLEASATDAGEVMPLTLFWRADQAVAGRYKVFVHLLDPRGFVVAQRDSEPVGGSRPTSSWLAGETVTDPYGLFVPFGMPPVDYQLEVGLYDAATGQRLKTAQGEDRLLLGPVRVNRPSVTPPIAAYGLTAAMASETDGLALVGYRLDKQGAEGQRDVVFKPGDAIHLTLFWRKTAEAAGDGAYRLRLGSLERQTTPTDGLYPIAQWAIGEVVRDDQIMLLPADWKAGSVVLELERGGVRVGEWRLTIEGG